MVITTVAGVRPGRRRQLTKGRQHTRVATTRPAETLVQHMLRSEGMANLNQKWSALLHRLTVQRYHVIILELRSPQPRILGVTHIRVTLTLRPVPGSSVRNPPHGINLSKSRGGPDRVDGRMLTLRTNNSLS